MRRVLFHVGGTPIHSYPAMLYLGIVLGIYAELFAASLIGLDRSRVLAATLILLTAALFGARLLFVAANWPAFRADPRRFWRFADGGASMYGGLLLALPLSLLVLTLLRLPFRSFWDVASLTMLVGMIVTRAGCFLNGCCAGRRTDSWLGMTLRDYRGVSARRFPTPLLEAAWGLLVLAAAAMFWRTRPVPGLLFLAVVGGYALGRALLESTREEQDRVLGLTLHRALSTVFVAVAIVAFALARR
jgi:phosphatidylglycerol:prolipoprotein diacylglycerol transferase